MCRKGRQGRVRQGNRGRQVVLETPKRREGRSRAGAISGGAGKTHPTSRRGGNGEETGRGASTLSTKEGKGKLVKDGTLTNLGSLPHT